MGIRKSMTNWLAVKVLQMGPNAREDASASNPDVRLEKGLVKRVGFRNGDTASKDFEGSEFNLVDIQNAYNVDGYVRQGVDKYVDQIFKEGYEFYGKDESITDYIHLRLDYMAEATGQPLDQFITEIAEDVVKYGNAIIVKVRMKDPNQLPPGITVKGIGGVEPVVGYFLMNPTTMKVKRDKNGTITGWQQDVGDKPATFKPEDVIHFYYKRERGNAFGTSFLIPVLDDVRALREAEENALRMLYRNIHPFYHIAVGTDSAPGQKHELDDVSDSIDNMNVEGGLITSNRVQVKPIASNQIVEAEPYLRYCEERVFSGMGIPGMMFGRGGTANRSTGDNMSSEMSDRIQAIQKTISSFFTHFVLREILLEGGYDPILTKEHKVMLRFHNNDQDKKIKMETHAIFQYEHNAITEDEMRLELGRDPMTDRAKMHMSLVTIPVNSSKSTKEEGGSSSAGSKETNNKQKPTNQHGTKSSPKKQTNSEMSVLLTDAKDFLSSAVMDVAKRLHKMNDDETIVAFGAIRKYFIDFMLVVGGLVEEYHDEQDDNKVALKELFDETNIALKDVVEYISKIESSVLADSVEIRLELFYDEVDRTISNHLLRKEA